VFIFVLKNRSIWIFISDLIGLFIIIDLLQLIIYNLNARLLCTRLRLSLFRMLQGLFPGYLAQFWQGTHHQILLFLYHPHLHCPCDLYCIFPEQMEQLSELLHLDELLLNFRGVLMIISSDLDCIGPSAIYRISLSFLVLFILMLIIVLFRSTCSLILN